MYIVLFTNTCILSLHVIVLFLEVLGDLVVSKFGI